MAKSLWSVFMSFMETARQRRGDAVASLTDVNAADGNIGSAVSLNVIVSVH